MRVIFTTVLLILGCIGAAQLQPGSLEVGGLTRNYEVFVPQTHEDTPLPLIIALHGRTGTGAGMAELTGFNQLAEREDVVVLYPDAANGEWNYTMGIPGYPADAPDDVAFLDVLVQKVAKTLSIDLKRLYVAGFSNGGFMAQRLACNAPGRYAAFASVAAAGFGGMAETCPGSRPLKFLFIHGTADSNVPWNGLTREFGGQAVPLLYSVPQTLEFWANYMGCSADLKSTDLPPINKNPQTDVRLLTFTGCPAGGHLALYAVAGGKHTWPGTGPELSELEATAAIWRFFNE